MELALPLIALGATYVISKQNNDNTKSVPLSNSAALFTQSQAQSQKEGFAGLNSSINNTLTNAYTAPQNYPTTTQEQLRNNVNRYTPPHEATESYLDQNAFTSSERGGHNVGQNINPIYSMSGELITKDNFTHNNMVPFTSARESHQNDPNKNVLDNMIGSKTHSNRKNEQAPLFKNEDNMNWINGTPNQTDFMRSRVNNGMSQNNTLPFEQEKVAPGLGLGYGTEGSTNGFNSGMESRDLYSQQTVDDLRIATNPKQVYDISTFEGPALSTIKATATIETQGKIEKRQPDTMYENNPNKWLTTTGASKGNTLRSINDAGIIRRCDGPVNYTGPSVNTEKQAGQAPRTYEQSRRQDVQASSKPTSNTIGNASVDSQIALQSQVPAYLPNNRSINCEKTPRQVGIINGIFNAAMAPIMDVIRPTRKDETIESTRTNGGIKSTINGSYTQNPEDRPSTTMKETTLYTPTLTVNYTQREGGYVANAIAPSQTKRDSTLHDYIGPSGGPSTNTQGTSYASAYAQTNNAIKSSTVSSRDPNGGTQIFNPTTNVSSMKCDTNRFDGRMNPLTGVNTSIPSRKTFGEVNAQTKPIASTADRNESAMLDAFRNNPFTHATF
jgi:hypothetical protein